MKGYNWTSIGNMTAGEEEYMAQKKEIEQFWTILKINPLIKIDENVIACTDRVIELWTWENFQSVLTSGHYT